MFEHKSLLASEGVVRVRTDAGAIMLLRQGLVAAADVSELQLELLERLRAPKTPEQLASELGVAAAALGGPLRGLFERALIRYAGCGGEIPEFEAFEDGVVGALASHGVAVVRNAIEPSILEALRAELAPLVDENLRDKSSVLVGKQRHSVPLPFEGTVADPRVFCPGQLRELLPALLGPRAQLYTGGLVMAEPGAPAQTSHRDDELSYGPALAEPFAFALALPLEPHPRGHGNTAFRVGSHRQRASMFESADQRCEFTTPTTELGDVYLFDYRVEHRGSDNPGPRARELVWFLYARGWYADLKNPYQRPLALTGHHHPDVRLDRLLEAARWRHAWASGASRRAWAQPQRPEEQA